MQVSRIVINNKTPRQSRRAFTMIELMVVIGIIAFLMAIGITSYGYVITNAREAATRTTLKLITENLAQRREAFKKQITEQDRAAGNGVPRYAIGFSGGKEVAKILGKKTLFRKYFPQIYADFPTVPSALAGNTPSAADSSELLYYFLTEGTKGLGVQSVDMDGLSSDQIKDTDGDGIKEIVDGWGNPLRFYRWPTRLLRPNGTSIDLTKGAKFLIRSIPAESNVDPDDPLGAIESRGNIDSSFIPAFEANYHNYNTYHTPLVLSAGADGQLGLYEPSDKTNFGHLARPITPFTAAVKDVLIDNISNLNTSGGGK